MKRLLFLFALFGTLALHGAEVTPASLNTMLGINIFAPQNSWQFAGMRSRLRLSFTGSTGRYSARLNRQIAGAAAVELVIYTANNDRTVSRITVIYANKGDTSSRTRSRIRNAGRQIKNRLSSLLGSERRENLSLGSVRIRADMWQCRFAGFYLESDKGEFTMLHILPPNAPGSGQEAAAKDYSRNVRRNDFGDVCIPNVPMVDQGPKGYCVPATMERVFLYYGITVDMHHLADVGGTDPDEGTYTSRMMRDIAALRRRAGLRSSEISGLSIRSISRNIDRGYPIVWQMYSTRELEEVYSFSFANRRNAATPAEWKRTLRQIDIPRGNDRGHVCLIVGYNRETDEIAVTNSWGQSHIAPRWIPVKVAQKVSRQLIVLYP